MRFADDWPNVDASTLATVHLATSSMINFADPKEILRIPLSSVAVLVLSVFIVISSSSNRFASFCRLTLSKRSVTLSWFSSTATSTCCSTSTCSCCKTSASACSACWPCTASSSGSSSTATLFLSSSTASSSASCSVFLCVRLKCLLRLYLWQLTNSQSSQPKFNTGCLFFIGAASCLTLLLGSQILHL